MGAPTPTKEQEQPQPAALPTSIDAFAEAMARAITKGTIDAETRLHRHSNEDVPLISHLNPKGDRDFPRDGRLQAEVFWVGRRVREMDLTHEEIDLFNELKHGVWKNGLTCKVTVDPDGKATRKDIVFPCSDIDVRNQWPSQRRMLRHMVHGDPLRDE